MERRHFAIRENWRSRCEEVGFDFHSIPSTDGTSYWQEGVAYEFTAAEVDTIDDATADLYALCMEHAGAIVASGDYPAEYGFNEREISLIEQSWKRNDLDLYGRFDLAYDGTTIKMFEFNGDTPTGLIEAAIAQWDWLQEAANVPHRDQFNSLHEKLIAAWPVIAAQFPRGTRLYFGASDTGGREDWGNLEYLADTCTQAGCDISLIAIDVVGFDSKQQTFVDEADKPIDAIFKLYPWEWLTREEFGVYLPTAKTRWIEPPWKMLLSNKALLPLLWKRFPNHPLLLESYFDTGTVPTTGVWVHKPLLAREGANITKVAAGVTLPISGSDFHDTYHGNGYVYQAWHDLPMFDGFRPLLGSWIVGGKTAGMGLREDPNDVIGNDSHFVPHYFI